MADSSGHGENLTYGGLISEGQAGALTTDADTAAYFNGSASAAPCGASPCSAGAEWSLGSGSMTIEAWVKTTTPGGMVFSKYECGWNNCVSSDGNANAFYEFGLNGSGQPFFNVRSDNGNNIIATSGVGVTDGGWHQIVGVWNRGIGTLIVYVDGAQQGIFVNGAPMDGVNDTSSPVSVGRVYRTAGVGGPYAYFTGTIDELSVYTQPLSGTRINAHYRAGQP
jgi:hypothetical protein